MPCWRSRLIHRPGPRALVDNIREWSAVQRSPAGPGDVRAQFDAWLKESGYNRDKLSSGRYVGDGVQIAWEAVKALATRQPVGATVENSLAVGSARVAGHEPTTVAAVTTTPQQAPALPHRRP